MLCMTASGGLEDFNNKRTLSQRMGQGRILFVGQTAWGLPARTEATFSLGADLGLIKGDEWRRFPALTCGAAPLSPGPLVAAGKQSIEQMAAGLAGRGRAGRRQRGSYCWLQLPRGRGQSQAAVRQDERQWPELENRKFLLAVWKKFSP